MAPVVAYTPGKLSGAEALSLIEVGGDAVAIADAPEEVGEVESDVEYQAMNGENVDEEMEKKEEKEFEKTIEEEEKWQADMAKAAEEEALEAAEVEKAEEAGEPIEAADLSKEELKEEQDKTYGDTVAEEGAEDSPLEKVEEGASMLQVGSGAKYFVDVETIQEEQEAEAADEELKTEGDSEKKEAEAMQLMKEQEDMEKMDKMVAEDGSGLGQGDEPIGELTKLEEDIAAKEHETGVDSMGDKILPEHHGSYDDPEYAPPADF